MANSLNTNPIVVDTAMTQSLKQTLGALSPFYIDEIYWLNPSASGDTFTVTAGAVDTTTIRPGRCENANQSQVFSQHGRMLEDLKVTQISSGTLYIYFH